MSSTLLTYAEALESIHQHVIPIEPMRTSWKTALGTTLAERIYAREPYPLFDNSAVDGFAVQAEDLASTSTDLPVALVVQEEVFAGPDLPRQPLQPGYAVKIMTGATIPEGANAVVMVEDTKQNGAQVLFYKSVVIGANIRRKSEEIGVGTLLLPAGQRIGSVEQGLLALQGITEVSVRPNPTVAILSTGDELVEPEEPIHGGQIRNTNTYTLSAELQQFGCSVINLGIGRDNRKHLRSLLQQGLEQAQVLITAGGVSAGEKDYLPALLEELGMERIFHKVAVKPGKPVLFGKRRDRVVFGLPGNVVSVLSSFHLFVKPALRLLTGRNDWRNTVWYARLGQAMNNPGGRTNFIRCRLSATPTGLPIAFPTGKQGSGMLTSMYEADGFAVIPADREQVGEFDVVEFIPILKVE